MKFIYTLLFIGLSFVAFSQTQKTLITKRTATWCPFCGSWGWQLAKSIEEKENPNGIVIRAHYSGDLVSDASSAITSNFGGIYQPEFYINEDKVNVGGSTWMDKISDFDEAISANAEGLPNVSFSGTSIISGNEISLEANVSALNDLQGEYFFAAYLLEDNVVNYQSSIGNDAVHNNVLRQAFSENVFGDEFGNGSVSSGFYNTYSFSITPEGGDVENRLFDILLVLWKKEGDKYMVENVDFFEAGQSTSILDIEETVSLQVYSTADQIIVKALGGTNINNSVLTLFDVSGKVVQAFSINNQTEFTMSLSNNLTNGIYFYQLVKGSKVLDSGKFNY